MKDIDGNDIDIREILSTIISYNGHSEWLLPMADEIEKNDYRCIDPTDFGFDYYSEPHCIMEILVQLFGDWGTSVRHGFISDKTGCVNFIRDICDEIQKEEYYHH